MLFRESLSLKSGSHGWQQSIGVLISKNTSWTSMNRSILILCNTRFFPLFDTYIYNLITTRADIRLATLSVLQDFAADGVVYLELRTTPRAIPSANITKQDYVSIVLETINRFNKDQHALHCNLILSIDRHNTLAEAHDVVELAVKHMDQGVVGVDLCGNPLKGDISIFKPAFARAKARGLGITVHFAEVAESGTSTELQTLLDFQPDRLGHVIHVPADIKEIIKQRRLGLELCLSCNVLAKLTEGGFQGHHFGEWRQSQCPITLSVSPCCSILYIFILTHFRPMMLVSSKVPCPTSTLSRCTTSTLTDAMPSNCHVVQRVVSSAARHRSNGFMLFWTLSRHLGIWRSDQGTPRVIILLR